MCKIVTQLFDNYAYSAVAEIYETHHFVVSIFVGKPQSYHGTGDGHRDAS